MGYDGSGGYDREKNFSADASAGIKILASGVDTEFNDFASAMTLPDLPMAGQKHVNVGAAASATDYLRTREAILQTPIYAGAGDFNSTLVSASVTIYVTASANQAPAHGSRLLVRSTQFKTFNATSSTNLKLTTPTGTNVSPIRVAGNYRVAPNQIRSNQTNEFIFNASATAPYWELMNPYAGTHSFAGPVKGINAAGTTAGVSPSNANFNFIRQGDLLILGNTGTVSVSCSISATKLFLSGAMDATFFGGVSNASGGYDALPAHVAMDVAGSVAMWNVTPKQTGSVEYTKIGANAIPANTVATIHKHTAICVWRRP